MLRRQTFCIPTELRYMCDTNGATSCLSVSLCAPCLASELCGSRSVRDARQWELEGGGGKSAARACDARCEEEGDDEEEEEAVVDVRALCTP